MIIGAETRKDIRPRRSRKKSQQYHAYTLSCLYVAEYYVRAKNQQSGRLELALDEVSSGPSIEKMYT